MTAAELEAPPELELEPVHLGPTWERDPDHPSGWWLPEATLGWGAVYWQEGRIQAPLGGQWRYTPEQLRFFLWWYAVDPASGRFTYRDGILQRLKGWGKDPIGASFCLTELAGPCRWDPAGREVTDPWGRAHPLGLEHPAPWIQLAAVSKEQTRNTMTLFPGMVSPQLKAETSMDLGKEIIYTHKGVGRLEAVTSSPRALEGGRPSFVLENETHHWVEANEGHAMHAVTDRNLTKAPGGQARRMALTNAYEPGEDSVAERDREAYELIQAGGSTASGVLYDSLEAPPDAPLTAEAIPHVVRAIRGDSTWLDVDRILATILDPRTAPSTARRFWFNQRIATEEAWLAPFEWDARARPGLEVAEGAVATLGFDGSRTDDHSALWASVVELDHLVCLGVWEPLESTGEVDREAIDGAVRRAHLFYDVVGFYSDLHPWESYVDLWAEELGQDYLVKASPHHRVAFDMRARTKDFTLEAARFHAAVVDPEATLTHDGNKRAAGHFYNARRAPNTWGVSVRKEHRESARKIDAVPSAILARKARLDYLALPPSRRRRKRTGSASFL